MAVALAENAVVEKKNKYRVRTPNLSFFFKKKSFLFKCPFCMGTTVHGWALGGPDSRDGGGGAEGPPPTDGGGAKDKSDYHWGDQSGGLSGEDDQSL